MTASSHAGSFTDRPYLLAIVLAAAMAVSTVAGTRIGVLGPYLRDEVGGVTASNLGVLVVHSPWSRGPRPGRQECSLIPSVADGL